MIYQVFIMLEKKAKPSADQTFDGSVHQNLPLKPHSTLNPNLCLSPYFQQYQQIMKGIEKIDIFDFSAVLAQKGFWYNSIFFYPSVAAQILNESQDNTFDLFVHFSHFSLNLSVYFHPKPCVSNSCLNKVGKGSFGTIYALDEKSVIKTIMFQDEKTLNKKFRIENALTQYAFYSIASVLQVGPKLTNSFGFDLIIYKDCIQFTIERCKSAIQIDQPSLLKSLKALHDLGIVHGDIKPDNIMYSEFYKKNVFIDFNCSTVIQEKIGERTFTNFKGTPSFASPEMLKLWKNKECGYVDMYYNDVFAFKKLVQDQEAENIQINYEPSQLTQGLRCLHSHLILRKLIIYSSYQSVQTFLQQKKDDLKPSKKLILNLSKKNINKDTLMQLSLNHYIYDYMVEEIGETLSLQFVTLHPYKQHSFKALLNSYFSEFVYHIPKSIFQQKVSVKLKSLITFFKTDYIVDKFCNFPIRLRNQYKSFINCQIYAKDMRNSNLPETSLKSLYQKFLNYKPTDQQLTSIVDQLHSRLKIQASTISVVKKMRQIDQHFYKTNKKVEIWKLAPFRKDRSNFIRLLVTKICQIKQISQTELGISRYPFQINLDKCNDGFQQKKLLNYPMKKIKFEELFALRIFKTLQYTLKPNWKALAKIQKQTQLSIYCKFTLQSSQVVEFQKIFGFLSTFFERSFRDSHQIINSLINRQYKNIIREKYALSPSILRSYFNVSSYYREIIITMIEDETSQVDKIIQTLKQMQRLRMRENEYLEQLYRILYHFLTPECNNIKQKSTAFLRQFFIIAEKYFCTLRIQDICQRYEKNTILSFNFSFLLITQEQVTDFLNQQNYLKKFQKWIVSSELQIEDKFACEKLLYRFTHAPKMPRQICLFSVLASNRLLFQYIILINQFYKKELFSGEKLLEHAHEEIMFDRMIELKYFHSAPGILSGLLLKKDFQRFFRYWKQIDEQCNAHEYKQIKALEVVGITAGFMQRYLMLVLYPIQIIKQLLLYYQEVFFKVCSLSPLKFLFIHIVLLANLFQIWKQHKDPKLDFQIMKTFELSLLYMLKEEKHSLMVIKNRFKENLGVLFRKLFKMKDYHNKMDNKKMGELNITINPMLLSQLRKKNKLKLYSVRRNLFITAEKLQYYISKLTRKFPAKVGELDRKFKQLTKNKQKHVPKIEISTKIFSPDLVTVNFYLNSSLNRLQYLR